MKCSLSRDLLALYVEGDLPDSQSGRARLHLSECAECRQFCLELRQRLSLLKSLRQVSVAPATLKGVRQAILSKIDNAREPRGWTVRLERFVLLGMRRPLYAAGALGILALVSVSLLGQMRQAPAEADQRDAVFTAAVFEGNDMLLRPEGYREWVLVGSSLGPDHSEHVTPVEQIGSFQNVYIDRSAYRTYAATGKFPEGTVMVLETSRSEARNQAGIPGSYEEQFVELEASVKDSRRFEGGWGYFDFTDNAGKLKAKAQALPQESGCRSCHQTSAETDHVFTQFYPVLRAAGAKS
jgi:hypothetical protein